MVSKNKKQGNSILLVLVIAMVITLLGSTLTSAIAYTTKQNVNNKNTEDLTYAAESGLEYAITNLRAKKIDVPNPPQEYKEILPTDIFGEYMKVEISIVREGDKLKIRSTATKDGKSRTVNATINVESRFVESDNRVFRYTLCAEKVNINCGGPLNPDVTRWNVVDIDNSSIFMNTAAVPTEVKFKEIENADFILPTFNFEAVNRVPEVEGTSISVHNLKGKPGVETIEYKRTPESNKLITIYLVNLTDGGELHLKSETIDSSVIITNGKIVIDDGLSLVLNHSTILARELQFKIAAFHSTFTLIQNVGVGVGHDKITDVDVDEIDGAIEGFCPNWNNSTGTSGEGEYELGDIVYN